MQSSSSSLTAVDDYVNDDKSLNEQIISANSYLKKHKLDAVLLPNKKIKLSDHLAAFKVAPATAANVVNQSKEGVVVVETTDEDFDEDDLDEEDFDEYDDEFGDEDDDEEEEDIESDDFIDDEEEEDEEREGEEEEKKIDKFITEQLMNDGTNMDVESIQRQHQYQHQEDEEDSEASDSAAAMTKTKSKATKRKKREPSLKLIQKLTIDDLQLIVNCIQSNNAQVFIADVNKANYVDKILKVQLLNDNQLSNGNKEALLKKGMFPKEISLLFDSFVKALCTERIVIENDMEKPSLMCQVTNCGFYSYSEAEIMRHIKRHLAQDGYTCSECGNKFASMTNLQRHARVHSGDSGKEVKCPHCDYKAATTTHVKRHMAHKHLERSLPCPHCTFMGATNAELKIHMARKHLELTGKNPLYLPKYLRKDYQCSMCKKQFNDFKEYQAHVYEHTSSSNRFQCSVCPYNCKNYSKLKRHMLYHSGSRNFECSICGNKFYQMEHLKRHLQSIHHQDTPTPMATIPTSAPPTLPQQQQHDGGKRSRPLPRQYVKPVEISNHIQQQQQQQQSNTQAQCYKVTSKCMYKCHQCEYSTIKLYSLNEHVINEHLGNNNGHETQPGTLLCSFCTYTTNKKINLKRHLQNNHSSQTTAPILLSNDALMIHPNTRFQCGLCRRYHTNINEFVKHITEKHKMQVCILDSNLNENIIQEQLQTRGRAELICTSNTSGGSNAVNDDLADLSQQSSSSASMSSPSKATIDETTNQVLVLDDEKPSQPPLPLQQHQRTLILQQQQQQQPHTTVRINPALNEMLMKRNLQPYNNKQRKMMIPVPVQMPLPPLPTQQQSTIVQVPHHHHNHHQHQHHHHHHHHQHQHDLLITSNEGLDEAAFAVNQLTSDDFSSDVDQQQHQHQESLNDSSDSSKLIQMMY